MAESLVSDARHPAVIDAFVAAINARDLDALDKVFTEDVLMEWPQSGERIRGDPNRREIYRRFPSLPTVTPRRVTGSGDVWVLEASLDYGGRRPLPVGVRLSAAGWPDRERNRVLVEAVPGPEWRAPWTERL